METAKTIATLSEAKGWSQTSLAICSGVSRIIMSKYERGEVVPSLDAAKKIIDAYEASLNYSEGEGQNAKFDKKTVLRPEDIAGLNPTIKDKLSFLIDTVIRDTNAQKANLR